MKWKLKSTASSLCLLIVLLFNVIDLNAQNHYQGIKNPSSANPYWKSYTEASREKKIADIKKAISLNISNFSLFEYALVLEELLQSYQNEGFEQKWIQYMDSLK